jgi:hypothetical protein
LNDAMSASARLNPALKYGKAGRPTNAERERRKIEAAAALMAPPPAYPAPDADPLAEKRARRKTNPFGGMTQKMARPMRPGFHRYWFNDAPGRIMLAQEAGYEHVLKDGAPETYPCGTNPTGGVMLAYHMEIPEEFYREDMAAQQAVIDRREEGYKRGKDEHGEIGKDGRYEPSRGIKFQTV